MIQPNKIQSQRKIVVGMIERVRQWYGRMETLCQTLFYHRSRCRRRIDGGEIREHLPQPLGTESKAMVGNSDIR